MVRKESSGHYSDARSLSNNSKGVPGGNTGELKSAREGTGAQPTSLRRLPKKSVLSNRHSSTHAKVIGTNLYFLVLVTLL